jgi:acyl-CoA hydrolase
MPKLLKPGELASLLRPGMKVFIQSASGEPRTLIQELLAEQEACSGIEFLSCQIPGLNRYNFAGLHREATTTGLFVTPQMSASYEAGKVRFMPLAYSEMYRYLASLSIDLALIQVTPTKRRGTFSLGMSVHFVPAILKNARLVVAEVNDGSPRIGQSVEVDETRLDYIMPTTHALPMLDAGQPSETIREIGRHVATLVHEGDHVQFGIGKVPGAVLDALRSHRRLSCHGGLISDPVIELYKDGALAQTSPITCTSIIGTKRLYDWVHERKDVRVCSVDYTHNIRVMAELKCFVAINSVLSVDLSGQANAETLNGRQVGGCGGLPDFVRGALLSEGGRSILALPSTTAQGSVSRIVMSLQNETVTVARSDADFVVTEHGVADLRRKSLLERAEALVAIAAPKFRDELFNDWERLQNLHGGSVSNRQEIQP